MVVSNVQEKRFAWLLLIMAVVGVIGYFALNDFYFDYTTVAVLGLFGYMGFVYVVSIIVHELGHWLGFLIFRKKKVKIRFNKERFLAGHSRDYRDLTNEEYFFITLMGVASGGLVIFLFDALLLDLWIGWQIYLVTIYLLGCRSDIKEIWKVMKVEFSRG